MAFIPKIIQFDTTDETPMSTLAWTGRLNEIDNVVKEYIVQNINHEFVQYLMDDENFLGFVVKVPYDIDTDKNAELTTPLLDVTERGPSLREEQIEKNRIAKEARMESYKNLMENKKQDEIAKKNKEARENYANTKSTNLGGTKRRKRGRKRGTKRRS
jgi:hypothetical protein